MNTLQIQVSEYVVVHDILVQIFESVKEFVDWIAGIFNQVVPQQQQSPDEGRAPPTLGISVSEVVATRDKFGPAG